MRKKAQSELQTRPEYVRIISHVTQKHIANRSCRDSSQLRETCQICSCQNQDLQTRAPVAQLQHKQSEGNLENSKAWFWIQGRKENSFAKVSHKVLLFERKCIRRENKMTSFKTKATMKPIFSPPAFPTSQTLLHRQQLSTTDKPLTILITACSFHRCSVWVGERYLCVSCSKWGSASKCSGLERIAVCKSNTCVRVWMVLPLFFFVFWLFWNIFECVGELFFCSISLILLSMCAWVGERPITTGRLFASVAADNS